MLLVVLAIALPLFIATPSALSNPFEVIGADHWAHRGVRQLVNAGLLDARADIRFRLGNSVTLLDLALWVGNALEQMGAELPDEGRRSPLSEWVASYNEANPERPLSADDQAVLRELLQLLLGQLEVLGFPLPADAGRPLRVDGMTRVLEGVRMRGESQIRYRDRSILGEEPSLGQGGSAEIEQSYSLRLSGAVTDQINLGAALRSESRLSAVGESDFLLDFDGVDIGVSRSAVARIGELSGAGFNELVLGGRKSLHGVQARVHTEQVDTTLLFGLVPAAASGGAPADEGGLETKVTAWDGSVQLSDRLRVGASVARLDREGDAGEESEKKLVFSLGGTYTVSPTLTLAGEMAQSATEEGGAGAFKIGAVIHPIPDLTLGAHLFALDSGYRSIFSNYEDRVARLDLSAEVGRWILSLRRQHILRAPEDPESEKSLSTDVTTEVGVRFSLDKGVLSLGYTLEDVAEQGGGGSRPLRAASASLEHAVGPIGKALAGFSIVEQEKGSETSSNIGVRYDFDDASVLLKYEVFSKPGEVTGNVTTAEVSIQF